MPERFQRKVVLVAGGTGGLGQAVSLAFLAEGATVAVTSRDHSKLEPLLSAAGAKAASIHGFAADATSDSAATELITSVISQFGRMDILVNTIGGYSGGAPLWETGPETLERMLSLNLRSVYTLLRATIPPMLARGEGAIVNVIAKAAVDHGGGAGAYAASKAGALAMTDSAAADLLGTGIRLNAVLPSIIDTEANRRAMPDANFSKWPKPDEIARVILFLASDDARVIHGAAIPVYGSR